MAIKSNWEDRFMLKECLLLSRNWQGLKGIPQRLRRWVVASLSFSMALIPLMTGLSGCATNAAVDNILADKNDVCYLQRKELADQRTNMTEAVVKGAVVGAVGGALVGALGAAAAGKKKDVGKAAAVGATAGAVLGGIAGYYGALQQQNGEQPNLFYSTLLSDADKENQHLRETNRRLDNLLTCRQRQAQSIRGAYRRKEIDRASVQQQMTDLRVRLHQDLEIARDIRKDLVERVNGIQFAGLKSAPGQVAYVDLEQGDFDDEPPSKGKGKSKAKPKSKKAPPPEVQKQLTEAPSAPHAKTKDDHNLVAKASSSVNQMTDNALLMNQKVNQLERLAKSSELETDSPT